VNSAHGGRTHDARVWRASLVCNYLEEMYAAGRRDVWLLGNYTFTDHLFLIGLVLLMHLRSIF